MRHLAVLAVILGAVVADATALACQPPPPPPPSDFFTAEPAADPKIGLNYIDVTNKNVYVAHDPGCAYLGEYESQHLGSYGGSPMDCDMFHHWVIDDYRTGDGHWVLYPSNYSQWTIAQNDGMEITTAGVYTVTDTFTDHNNPPGTYDGVLTRHSTLKVLGVNISPLDYLKYGDSHQFTASVAPQVPGQYYWWTPNDSGVRFVWGGRNDNTAAEGQTVVTTATAPSYCVDGAGIGVTFVSEPDDTGTTVSVYDGEAFTVYYVALKSVVFPSSDGVLTNYNADYTTPGGTVYSPCGWAKNGPNNPITHTKGSSVVANVTVCVAPCGEHFDLTGDGGNQALTFHKTNVVSTGSDQTLSITSDAALSAQILVLDCGISWALTVKDGPGSHSEWSGPHKVYVTWGQPGSGPTIKRVDWACNIAKGAYSKTQAAQKFRDALADDPGYSDPQFYPEPWVFLDSGDSGDCITLAKLACAGLDMVGIYGGYRWAYPTADGSDGYPPVSENSCDNQIRQNFAHQGAVFEAKLVFPASNGLNNFEGFFIVQDPGTKAYTIFPPRGPIEDDTYLRLKVLRSVASDQLWVWNGDQSAYVGSPPHLVTVTDWDEVPGAAHVPVPDIP